jgi:hypothetical protein
VNAKARLREERPVPAARLEWGSPSKEPLTFSWTARRILEGGAIAPIREIVEVDRRLAKRRRMT